jgi:hypothetical protein
VSSLRRRRGEERERERESFGEEANVFPPPVFWQREREKECSFPKINHHRHYQSF